MSTRSTALVTVLGSLAVILSVVAILVVVTRDRGDDGPAHDAELWQRAKTNAGYWCSLEGIGGGDASAIYSEEFRACVKDRTPVEYADLEAGN